MNLDFDKLFDTQFAKLTKFQKQATLDALELFIESPLHESLRNHELKGKWTTYR